MALQLTTQTLLSLPSWPVLAGAVVVALGIDRWLGEPRERWHPVVWMGHYLGAVGVRIAPLAGVQPRPMREFLSGLLAWGVGALLVVVCAFILNWAALQLPALWMQMFLLGWLLKPLLAWRMLRDEVLAVEHALADSLDAGRQRVSRLVSRDVSALDATQVREAALSTLAENLNDSVVAPLFWFAVAGLPGAAIYRFANTADAMWGYVGDRQGRHWFWAGKCAARIDDAMSWLPARLTALLMGLPTLWRGGSLVFRCAGLTPSPNSGWPMGALAVGLGICLRKTGAYRLNPLGDAPVASDTGRAVRLCGQVLGMLTSCAALTACFLLALQASNGRAG